MVCPRERGGSEEGGGRGGGFLRPLDAQRPVGFSPVRADSAAHRLGRGEDSAVVDLRFESTVVIRAAPPPYCGDPRELEFL